MEATPGLRIRPTPAQKVALLEQQHWWAADIDVNDGPGTKRKASDAGFLDASDSKKPRSGLEATAYTIRQQDAELQRLRADIANLRRQLAKDAFSKRSQEREPNAVAGGSEQLGGDALDAATQTDVTGGLLQIDDTWG